MPFTERIIRSGLMALLLTLSWSYSVAQLTIAPNTIWHNSRSTLTAFSISGNISIQSDAIDVSQAPLTITGTNQVLSASSVTFRSLIINAQPDSKISLVGEWTVGHELDLISGIVQPAANAKLIFNGTVQPKGSDLSFVEGPYYAKGKGNIVFPIGYGSSYLPAVINNVQNSNALIALSVVAGSPAWSGTTVDALDDHYYSLTADAGAITGSLISLFPGSSILSTAAASHDGAVIFQGGDPGSSDGVVALGGQQGLAVETSLPTTSPVLYVTSTQSPTSRYLVIGASSRIEIVIFDLITPFTQDAKNDKLRISNIELFPSNKVTLMDRWGQPVREWANFTNEDSSFDFTKLSAGNYICIVEYTPTGKTSSVKVAQMVTVLKSK